MRKELNQDVDSPYIFEAVVLILYINRVASDSKSYILERPCCDSSLVLFFSSKLIKTILRKLVRYFPVGLNASAMHCVLVFAASKGLVECILNPSQKLLSQFLDASVKLLEDGEAS